MFPNVRLSPLLKALYVSAILGLPMTADAETLQEALISAYNSNPALMAERARVREVDETYIQARSQGRLQSSAAGSVGLSATRLPNISPLGTPISGHMTLSSEPRSLQLQVIQPIYQGGRVRALKNQAKAGIMAAREGLRAEENALFLNVATSYSDVRRDEAVAHARRSNVRVLSHQLTAANDRFDVGVGTLTDTAQAKARLASAEIGLAQADAQLQMSRATFIRLVGHPPESLQPVPEFELPKTVDAALAIAQNNNPHLSASYYNEQAADSAITAAKSASKPTISLTGTAQGIRGQVGAIQRAESAAIAAQINIPIFAGGYNKSKIRAAKHAATRAMFETRDAQRAIDQTVMQVWAGLDAARRSLSASQIQVEAAKVAFEGVQLEQQVGTRNTLDVLNAEQELLNAKLAVINAEAAVETTEFQLLNILGAFDAGALQLPIDHYDPTENFETVRQDGLKRTIETYVPVAVQKIGGQVPDITEDIVDFTEDGFNTIIDTNAADTLGDVASEGLILLKSGVDTITGQ